MRGSGIGSVWQRRDGVTVVGARAGVGHNGGVRDDRFHVSVVCTGNICRSPMAAIVLRHAIAEAGLADRVRVTSAGTGPWHVGGPAHAATRRVLEEAGFDTEHIAHQMTAAEMPTVDLLLAADRTHLAALSALDQPAGRGRHRSSVAVAPDRILLFRSFDPDADDHEIPDPYGGPPEEFAQVMTMVRAAVPGVVAEIRRRLG